MKVIDNLPAHLIIYDGECMLCNKSVKYLIKKDTKGLFKFTQLQSSIGQQLLKKFNLSTTELSTVMYLNKDKIHIKSTAVIKAFSSLGSWRKSALILFLFPRFMRDHLYDIIAKKRGLFFKKEDYCIVPTEDIKSRFI